MTSLSNIALSGMHAAQTRLNASAHNIANLDTPGFSREEVVQSQLPGGGVAASLERSDVPGPALEEDVVAQLQAKNAFLANLAVFRTGNALAGVLLNEKA